VIKEPLAGADFGLIVDMQSKGHRVVKAVWIQAKRADEMPDDPSLLPDFAKQLKQMLSHTKESYGMVYTPNDIHIFKADNPTTLLSVSTLVTDTLHCLRGDRDRRVVAESVHRTFLIELAVFDTSD
jgi:hypothetical protein